MSRMIHVLYYPSNTFVSLLFYHVINANTWAIYFLPKYISQATLNIMVEMHQIPIFGNVFKDFVSGDANFDMKSFP